MGAETWDDVVAAIEASEVVDWYSLTPEGIEIEWRSDPEDEEPSRYTSPREALADIQGCGL